MSAGPSLLSRNARRLMALLLLSGALFAAACRPYRLPSPKGPPQPKVKKAKLSAENQSADGRALESAPATEVKVVHNNYDKDGLLKKKKYKRRRLTHKTGQRKILGITLPF